MTLSVKCDTTSNYIGQIEMGRRIPSFDKIEKIAEALGISSHELFVYNNEEKQKETKINAKDYLEKMPLKVKKEIVSRMITVIRKDIDDAFNGQNY